MDMKTTPRAAAAGIVLPAPELDAALKFFTERLGFQLDAIFPAILHSYTMMGGGGH